MYSQKFATAIKVAGKVLRENGEMVALPFGAEYVIHLKNLNSVRALVSVEIDGVDATGGTRLIIPANGSIDFERFINEGNMDEGLRFKFIERTKKIENGPRGISAEDGLIRIEFEFEQQRPVYVPPPRRALYNILRSYDGDTYGGTLPPTADLMNSTRSATFGAPSASSVADMTKAYNCSTPLGPAPTQHTRRTLNRTFKASGSVNAEPLNDVGITVGGSVSDQKFVQGARFPTDGVKHVMILKLLGQVGEQPVKEAITVKTRQECPTCGTKNKFGTKFCKECGTGLTVV